MFFSKNLKTVTCQFIIVPRGSLQIMTRDSVIVVFNLVPNLNFWFNIVLQSFKMIQFCPLPFETKLVNKLNYNLYIHVTITFSK